MAGDSHIWRAYDIRGNAQHEITKEFAQSLGLALSTLFIERGKEEIVIARDARSSSEELNDALIEGLIQGGIEAYDIGLAPTPALYFAVEALGFDAGIMITASHNPASDNGFKFRFHNAPFQEEDLQQLQSIFETKSFVPVEPGARYQIDTRSFYLDSIVQDLGSVTPKLRVVVDGGNGVAGPWMIELLERLGCTTIPLYCEPDPLFPNHPPDPTKQTNLQDLQTYVNKEQADCGIALDGDGDRLAVVSTKGACVFGDRLLALLAQDLLKWKRGSIVHDLKCSMMLRDVIEEAGGTTITSKTGYPRIQNAMKKHAALLGGEQSSHICFSDRWFGFDDALYAAARILPLIPTLDQRLEALPSYPSTPELRLPVPEEQKSQVIATLKPFLSHFTCNELDGIHCSHSRGWALLRPSNTEACMSLRIEAKDENTLKNIANTFYHALSTTSVDTQDLLPFIN